MDLREALRTTGAVRDFEDAPIPDRTVADILDTARFAPSGGNRQGWRVVVVGDPGVRRQLRDLYLEGWYEYLAQGAAGLVAWAPVTDREAERTAVAGAPALARRAAAGPGGFAENLDRAPVLLLVLADLRVLAAVDRDFDRYSFAGGASVYPFCWSILLAARQAGLAGVMTTMAIRSEPAVKALFGVPDPLAVAALVALGRPTRQPRHLTRRPVEEFTTLDRFDGPAFGT
jgi:nitroreductase